MPTLQQSGTLFVGEKVLQNQGPQGLRTSVSFIYFFLLSLQFGQPGQNVEKLLYLSSTLREMGGGC